MKVTVIIASHNGKKFLAGCIEAIKETILPPGVSLQVIVVDNGSNDGTADWLKQFSMVETIVSKHSMGFSQANNAARSLAQGEVVVFLNNDTRVDKNWLMRPLEILALDPEVVAVGSKLLFMHRFVRVRIVRPQGGRVLVGTRIFGNDLDNKIRWSSDASELFPINGQFGRWLSNSDIYLPIAIPELESELSSFPTLSFLGFEGEQKTIIEISGRKQVLSAIPGIAIIPDMQQSKGISLVQNAGSFVRKDGSAGDVGSGIENEGSSWVIEEEVPSLCGAALIVRRSALDAVAWFPEYYGMYYEDTDLCLQLRQHGGKLIFCPDSIVNHYHTGTNREHSPHFIQNVACSSFLFTMRYGSVNSIKALLRQRLRDLASECSRKDGLSLRKTCHNAHGFRGTLQAILALPLVAKARLKSHLAHSSNADLLCVERKPYLPSNETK